MATSGAPAGRDVRVSRGRHRNPGEGTCLMELATVVAGEPFSDRPRCVHPTLASIARLVNDHVGETPRQRLMALLPAMMSGPYDDPRLGPVLVLSCLDSAEQASPRRRLTGHRRRALRRLTSLTVGPAPRWKWWGNFRYGMSGFRSVLVCTCIALHHGDDALERMLTDAVGAYRAYGVGTADRELVSAVG